MLELLVKGGWVMYLILGCSVAALAVTIERAICFFHIRGNDQELLRQSLRLLEAGRISEAVRVCEASNGPVAATLAICFRYLSRGTDRRELQDAVEREGSTQLAELGRHLEILAVIAQAAPLLGLLGTVLGMIQAFMRVEQAGGQAETAVLAGGIWEALLTTAFGLIVAIPAMLAYHYFESRLDDYEARIRRSVHRILSREEERGR